MSEINIEATIQKMIENIDNEAVRKEIANQISAIAILAKPDELKKLLDVFLKYPEGLEVAKNNWSIIYNNTNNSPSVIESLSKCEEAKKDMLDNIKFLINYGNYTDISDLAKELAKIEGGSEIIAENFEYFLEDCNINPQYIAIPLIKTELGKEKLKKYFGEIKDKFFPGSHEGQLYPKDFFEFIEELKDIPEFEKEYEDYSYWAKLYNEIEMPNPETLDFHTILTMPRQKQIETLILKDAIFVKDLEFANFVYSKDRDEKKLIFEKVANGNKYKYLSCGSSSLIVQAGDQVVKIGAGRRKFQLPYHPRIMMPYFRKEYSDGSCLEVFNYGVVDSAQITDEKLLEIYKELESAGIVWGDARKENLLVLTKDNEIPDFIKGDDFGILGFLNDERFPTNNHTVLKKGDIVICDLDMLYTKDDPNYEKGYMDEIIETYLKDKKREKLLEEH